MRSDDPEHPIGVATNLVAAGRARHGFPGLCADHGAVTALSGSRAFPSQAVSLLRAHLANRRSRKEFVLLGRRWMLLTGVFSPIHNPVTELLTTWLPYPVGGTLLEIGCGAGITSVVALDRGCERVVAVDINGAAVRNTRLNAERHGVTDRIRVRHGDLYEALAHDETFDLIYWNSNFIDVPEDHVFESDLDYAYFDPGYRVHRRYLRGAAAHLRPGVGSCSGSAVWATGTSSNWRAPRWAWCRRSCEPRKCSHAV
jgi:release factor glutamine methyltransferase